MSEVIPFPAAKNRVFEKLWAEIGPTIVAAMNGSKAEKAEIFGALGMLAGSATGLLCNGDMTTVEHMLNITKEVAMDTAQEARMFLREFDGMAR